MSSSERRRWSKRFRTLCAACQKRKAKFRYRGDVRGDADHPPSLFELRRGTTLCFECYRGEINRARARRLTERATPPRMPSPFGRQEAVDGRLLDQRQIAHRQRMLDHLQRSSAVAC